MAESEWAKDGEEKAADGTKSGTKELPVVADQHVAEHAPGTTHGSSAVPRAEETNEPTEHVPIIIENRRGGGMGWMVAAGVIMVVALFIATGSFLGWLPRLSNPFDTKTIDRSQPVLLKSIKDMSRYQAALGTFQVVIDMEKDVKYVPSALAGQRVLFVGSGTVTAYVDFSRLDKDALEVSEDRTSAQIRLPAPALDDPKINIDQSYVFAEKRGLLNRIGDAVSENPNKSKKLYQTAEKKIATAAKKSDLRQRAQDNTKRMLEGMLKSLGFTTVTVTFTKV